MTLNSPVGKGPSVLNKWPPRMLWAYKEFSMWTWYFSGARGLPWGNIVEHQEDSMRHISFCKTSWKKVMIQEITKCLLEKNHLRGWATRWGGGTKLEVETWILPQGSLARTKTKGAKGPRRRGSSEREHGLLFLGNQGNRDSGYPKTQLHSIRLHWSRILRLNRLESCPSQDCELN